MRSDLYDRAWRAFLDEDYETSLADARACLDGMAAAQETGLTLVDGPGLPLVQDAVVLASHCLYQLDRYEDFEMLAASAGRWGLVPEQLPALDVVHLSFACKRGDYARVVGEATAWIDAHRGDLPPAIAEFLHLRGVARSHLGEAEASREDAEAAFALFRVLGRDFEAARTANLLGIVEFRTSRYAEAERWWRRAHELHARLGMLKNMGGNRLNLGIACYKQGRLERAVVELDAAVRLLEQVDARVSLCRAAIARGNVLRLQGRRDEARRELAAAYENAGQLGLAREEALALEFMGDVHRDAGRAETARRYYSRAFAVGSSLAPAGDIVTEVLWRQGECLLMQGRPADAVKAARQSLDLARRLGDRFEEGCARRVLGEAQLELGDLENAEASLRDSVRLLREVGGGHDLGLSRLACARLALARLDAGATADVERILDAAWDEALAALDLYLKMDLEEHIVAARKVLTGISDRRQDLRRHGPDPAPARRGAPATRSAPAIIHVSPIMRDTIQLADAFAESDEPVLITGETGTGKELFARRLHHRSRRRRGELVCVNVAAIPATVFERELFGHVKGAFSGADADGRGLAALADGGTLFLDEIGELPLELQPKLLRLLQDGAYHAIGDPAERRADIRLVAATNADLKQLVAQGRFRADLYYRLKILELRLPPVRERRGDVLPLLRHFLAEAAGGPVEVGDHFNDVSLELLQRHDWPGNVREIAMVARQACVQAASRGQVAIDIDGPDGQILRLSGPGAPARDLAAVPADGDDAAERSRLLLALAEARGNRAKAARRLGVSRSTLYRQLERHGIGVKAAATR